MKKGAIVEEKIIKIDYEDEMKKSFIDYAMSVIMDRALPDVRDGLKPVHRRILYSMHELGLDPSKSYRKCARIVGDTLGKFHPHGDSAVYESLVRMAQDFSMNVPLVQGHGNFGSIDGDGAAAMRYTEAKLGYPANEFLKDLEKHVVDLRDNFDATLKEPTVLPARFPNLLVNGTTGIAVGMATNIPSHNLNEVIKATIDLIDNPNITVAKLMKNIKGPDFPTGGIIVNKDDLLDMYEKGTGKLRIRAKIVVEDAGYGKTNLVVTEIPYTSSGSKTKLLEKIIELVRDKKLDELSDVRDESSKDGLRIVMEVKRGINTDNLLNKLYKKTPLEDTMPVNFLALVEGSKDSYEPRTLNLKQIIEHFIKFQREITTRKYEYLLDKADEKQEVLEGLIKAHDIIDLIVEILRGSQDVKMAKDCLMFGKTEGIKFKTKKSEKDATKLNFTERQTLAILDMRLQKLINLELQKLMDELDETIKNIQFYKEVLGKESKLLEVIKDYLNEIKKTYGTKRKTEIENAEVVDYVEVFKEEELYVLVDRFNYGKTIEPTNYNRSNEETLKDFKHIFNTKNTDKLCMFTNDGNLYQIKLTDMPKSKVKDKGVPLDTLAKINKHEEIICTDIFSTVKVHKFLFTTKDGLIKVTDGSEFESIRTCIASTKLDDNDKLVSVLSLNPNESYKYVLLLSEQGYALKFDIKTVSELKRNSKGVKTMILGEGDNVKDVYLLKSDDSFVIKVNGKDIDVKAIKTRRRNQMGLKL